MVDLFALQVRAHGCLQDLLTAKKKPLRQAAGIPDPEGLSVCLTVVLDDLIANLGAELDAEVVVWHRHIIASLYSLRSQG